MKQSFVSSLVIGQVITEEAYLLKEIGKTANGAINVLFADKSGEIPGKIKEGTEIEIGAVYSLTGVVLANGRDPVVFVKHLEPAKDFIPSEVFSGLTREKEEEYISFIKDCINHLKGGYKELLEAAYNDAVFKALADRPASLGGFATYVGGALAATAQVAAMVIGCLNQYQKKSNGIYSKNPRWNLLVAAALLLNYGTLVYFEKSNGYRKSSKGVALHYFASLQSILEDVVRKKHVKISDEEFSLLLNVLAVSTGEKTSVKAVTKEGSALRAIASLYKDLDMIDKAVAEFNGDEEDYFFNPKTRQYLSLKEEEVS